MNAGVELVRAYLNVNGYFTVTEYPVMDAEGSQPPHAVTDLDILAYRFAGAGHELVHPEAEGRPRYRSVLDPALRASADEPDMIIGEVKEGRAALNPAIRRPGVMAVALTRFGCCPAEEADRLARELVHHGRAVTASRHHVRTVAFGGHGVGGTRAGVLVVPMDHVLRFLAAYIDQVWPVLRHAQISDPALSLLALMKKNGVTWTARAWDG